MKKLTQNALLICSIAIVSCDGEKKDTISTTEGNITEAVTNIPTQSSSETEKIEVLGNILNNADALKKAEEALKNLPNLKGKDIRVFQDIHFYGDGRIMLDIQDPNNPNNVDNYVFRNGVWEAPQPVQIYGDGDMSANMFSMSQFPSVAKIYKQLEDKPKEIEGAKISDHVYGTLSVIHQEVKVNTNIDGTREKWLGYFKPDGSLIEFKKR